MCCIPVHLAAFMIGSLHTFRLVANMFLQEYYLALTEILIASAFLTMIAKDSKKTRVIFFAQYCFYIMLINAMELYYRRNPTEDERESKLAYFQ